MSRAAQRNLSGAVSVQEERDSGSWFSAELRRGPTGREKHVGMLSQDCASLHPGLFSYLPSGKTAAAPLCWRQYGTSLKDQNIHAIVLESGYCQQRTGAGPCTLKIGVVDAL